MPVHAQILAAARRLADRDRRFKLADLVAAVPHLNAGTVRTHVASRCCTNAPSHHQSRHPYFRAIGRGWYRIEPRFAGPSTPGLKNIPSQDRLIATFGSGLDDTLVREALRMSPTDRLEMMRLAALSLDSMSGR